jgi:hypothetical protein
VIQFILHFVQIRAERLASYLVTTLQLYLRTNLHKSESVKDFPSFVIIPATKYVALIIESLELLCFSKIFLLPITVTFISLILFFL